VALVFWGIDWGMPRTRPSALDNLIIDGLKAHAGTDLSRSAIDVYPPLCYLQMSLAFAVVRPLTSEGHPVEVAARYILAARTISALLTLGTALLAAWMAVLLSRTVGGCGRTAGLLAAAVVLFNPAALYYAKTTNAEASYVFYLTLAFALLLWWFQDETRRGPLIGFFLAVGAATAAKDQAAFVLLGPICLACWRCPRLALPSLVCGGALWLATYFIGGDILLLNRHIEIMREMGSKHYTHSTSLPDLLDLTARFCFDILRVVGPLALIGALAWCVSARSDKTRRPWALLMAGAFVPYLISILFLAHRTNPRYALPLLPLAAVPTGILLARLALTPRGKRLVAGLLACLLLWGVGLLVHLAQNPVDASKRALRASVAAGHLPSPARLSLFSMTRGIIYKQNAAGKWRPKATYRNWSREKYGWVSDEIRLVGLMPELPELEGLAPELALYSDRDPVPPPRRGYDQAGRFEPVFGGFYNYLQLQSGLTLYVRVK